MIRKTKLTPTPLDTITRITTEMRALRRRPVRFRSADHGTTYGVVRRDARPVPRRAHGARGNAVRRIGIRVGMSVGRVSVVRCIGPILCPSSRAWVRWRTRS